MANETVLQKGATGYATLQASISVAAGAMSAGARTTPLSAFAADEEDYIALDFQLKVTVGTPSNLQQVKIYRRASDGTNQSPAPTPSYLHEPVSSFLLTNTASSTYYVYGVTAGDPNDEYYIFNNGAGALTIELLGRASTFNSA